MKGVADKACDHGLSPCIPSPRAPAEVLKMGALAVVASPHAVSCNAPAEHPGPPSDGRARESDGAKTPTVHVGIGCSAPEALLRTLGNQLGETLL